MREEPAGGARGGRHRLGGVSRDNSERASRDSHERRSDALLSKVALAL